MAYTHGSDELSAPMMEERRSRRRFCQSQLCVPAGSQLSWR